MMAFGAERKLGCEVVSFRFAPEPDLCATTFGAVCSDPLRPLVRRITQKLCYAPTTPDFFNTIRRKQSSSDAARTLNQAILTPDYQSV